MRKIRKRRTDLQIVVWAKSDLLIMFSFQKTFRPSDCFSAEEFLSDVILFQVVAHIASESLEKLIA